MYEPLSNDGRYFLSPALSRAQLVGAMPIFEQAACPTGELVPPFWLRFRPGNHRLPVSEQAVARWADQFRWGRVGESRDERRRPGHGLGLPGIP